jgi:hypothetical protein
VETDLCKKNVEVYQLALKMAGSGKFKNWKGIRDSLVEQGHRRAPDRLMGIKFARFWTFIALTARTLQRRPTASHELSSAAGWPEQIDPLFPTCGLNRD